MSDVDVLERAARALRAAHTGEREGSGFTRARILGSFHRERRQRILRWAVFSPLASLLLVGSAWAQSTGKWPVVWRAVTSVFVAAPSEPDPVRGGSRAGGARSPQQGSREGAAAELEAPLTPPPVDSSPPEPAPESAPEPALESTPEPPAPKIRTAPRRARASSASSPNHAASASTRRAGPVEEPQPPEVASDPELASFRTAHDLHFQSAQPRKAIAAYAAYLDAFPSGRFVPEARYNTALNWIKLGDKKRAREALRPFVSGRHGDYRREEAEQLLNALR
jgi:TolA-binding protein